MSSPIVSLRIACIQSPPGARTRHREASRVDCSEKLLNVCFRSTRFKAIGMPDRMQRYGKREHAGQTFCDRTACRPPRDICEIFAVRGCRPGVMVAVWIHVVLPMRHGTTVRRLSGMIAAPLAAGLSHREIRIFGRCRSSNFRIGGLFGRQSSNPEVREGATMESDFSYASPRVSCREVRVSFRELNHSQIGFEFFPTLRETLLGLIVADDSDTGCQSERKHAAARFWDGSWCVGGFRSSLRGPLGALCRSCIIGRGVGSDRHA